MPSRNLTLLSDADRADIELQKQASLIVFKLRNDIYDRRMVKEEIAKSKNSERLRELINYYRSVR